MTLPNNSNAIITDTGQVKTDPSVSLLDDPSVQEIVNAERDQLSSITSKNDNMPTAPRKIEP